MTAHTALDQQHALTDASLAQGASSIGFCVTAEMVAAFAELTGDRSSLHVNDVMARRSAYRRPIVHGMLPVAFLCLTKPFRRDGWRTVPIALTGRFAAPVFVGDALTLTVELGGPTGTDNESVFAFRIANDASGATTMHGEVTLRYVAEAAVPSATPAGAQRGMLVREVELNNYQLEQIEKGMKERLEFCITGEALRSFVALLARGVDGADNAERSSLVQQVSLPNLLAILLFSTSVGVMLPGASATFLEFAARTEREVQLGVPYALEGEVSHRSGGTRIVKKQLVVRAMDAAADVVLRGKVATLVNKMSRAMPSIGELKDSAMNWGLEGKVALITGASRGIGETTAKLLALCGARVVVNYHRGADDAARVVGEITEAGGEAVAIGADVTRTEDVTALVDGAVKRFGAVDILVNNAVRDFRPIPFAQLTWDEVQKDIDVVAKGAFLCCQRVIPLMLERGGGKIINISTVAVDDPPLDQTKYVMAKSALVGLTRSLAIELAPRNIQVNMVVPNFVETDLVAHIQEGFRKKIADDTPMGRHASPVDVARAIVFLASSLASFTTGQKIMVTGGGAPYL